MRRLLLAPLLLLAACGGDKPGGANPWQAIALGTDAAIRDLSFVDDQHGWMVGAAGGGEKGAVVGVTEDGGLTWRFRGGVVPPRYQAPSIALNAVGFVTPRFGVAAGQSGTVLRSEDGGETWQQTLARGPVYSHWRDVDFVDLQHGWMIGRGGVIATEDTGASWTRLDPPDAPAEAGLALDMLDLDEGWMVGKHGLVLHSTDGGRRWSPVNVLGALADGAVPDFAALHFVDRDHGWIAGTVTTARGIDDIHRAVLLHSADGGASWQSQLEDVECILTAVRFADAQRGWALGFDRGAGTSTVLATADGGGSWDVELVVHGEELAALEIGDAFVWAVGDRSREEPQRLFRRALDAPVVARSRRGR